MMKTLNSKILGEINFQGDDYISIGDFMDGSILRLFPKEYSKLDWSDYLQNSSLLIQIWSLGFLLNEFCNNEKSFENYFGITFHSIISKNQFFIKKWFSDNGINLSGIFLNFVYGTYSSYGSYSTPVNIDTGDEKNDAKPGDDLIFEDGAVIKFYNKNMSWNDIYENVFIEKKYYEEFVSDIDKIKESFL